MNTLNVDFEALKQDHWTEKERTNAERIAEFVQHLMNDHDFDYVRKEFGDANYVQHNRNIPDGILALIDYVEAFANRFPDYGYDVKRITADGDTVTFHSHATVNKSHRGNDGKGLNIIDSWRVVDGEILEHWDAIQPLDAFMRFYVLMTGGQVRNQNGVF